MKHIFLIIFIQVFSLSSYSLTSLELQNRSAVNTNLRNKINRDVISSRAYQQSIRNMISARSPLDITKLGKILKNIEFKTNGPRMTENHSNQILDCFNSDSCFLSVYYAGYARTPAGHGRRFYNNYVFFFLNAEGELQLVDGLLGKEDFFKFDFGSFSIDTKVPLENE